ncbi:MAG: type I-E CRISPR-associated protein Cse1/CasA [Dehalococcoidia bacterium]|nr:type I-E CRISPR-associated protein Cse1/CasA [Dehalococcoidia bacterium]MCA9845917.1 type I-E CRISPR-associated protein Cse1/CasA [Dehalococcoidia bacterium]
MSPRFNLIAEPWIPVLWHGESQTREISLREALARAPDIVEISDPSPLVTAALYRLLLAICHRVWGPESEESWGDLWAAETFDTDDLDRYLEEWRSRFDLFDSERPFYQAPGLPESVATTVAKLGHELASGNNPALFDHSVDDVPVALDPGGTARLLVALQGFALGGLITRLKGDPPSAEASHLIKAAIQVVTGNNLFETLVLNMLPVDEDTGPLNMNPATNIPAWESEPAKPEARMPAGLVDLLTWQSRRVLLFPGADGQVERAAIMAGFSMPAGWSIEDMEPMVTFVLRESRNQYPWAPVGFRPEQALWRQSATLLEHAKERGRRAQALSWLNTLRNAGYLDRDAVGLSLFGLASDRAKIFLWREERLPLPLAYLENPDLVAELDKAVGAARSTATALRRTTWSMASETLGPGGTADRDRASSLADSLAPERAYWPRLDEPFRRYMLDLAPSFASDSAGTAGLQWLEAVRGAATSAFEAAATAIETSSRGYRAAALYRPRFQGEVRRVLNEFMPTQEEVTA